MTIAEGLTTGDFTITTQSVGAPTPVTITAAYSLTRTATMTVATCATWVADTTPFGSETVWFDDAGPAGASFVGPWIWDTAQKNSGLKSHTSGIVTGGAASYFRYSPTTLNPLTESDMLVTYALVDPCHPPREIMLQFWDGSTFEHRAYWGENLIVAGTDGTVSRYPMGAMPPAGRWVRLAVSAAAVGLVGKTVSGIAFNQYDGRVWFDRTGMESCTFTAAEPVVPATDVVWVEDSLPSSASASGGSWIWDTTKKASGTQSHTELPRAGYHGNYFYGSYGGGLTVAAGETLFVYALLNPCDPPREIMLELYDGVNWGHRAYWGENLQMNGTDGTSSRQRIGDLPPAGVWTRLEIPAELVGMNGRTLNGIAFGLYDGQVWFDRAGKAPAQSSQSEGVPATMLSASAGEEPESAVPADTKQPPPSRWRRFLRRLLRRPNRPVPPVSMSVETQFIGETNSTIDMKRYSFYSPELQLMAETSTTAVTPWIANEYVWFNGEPLAQINRATGEVAYYFNDHLGAPILQTDATGAVVWRVERDPYGERYATRVGAERHQPLGLPGQEYDPSSDRQYNVHRWYRSSWGRFTTPDPGGLAGGLNVFAYVEGRPTVAVDPLGLAGSLYQPNFPDSYVPPNCTATGWQYMGNIERTFNPFARWNLIYERELGIADFQGNDASLLCQCVYKYAGTFRPHERTEIFERTVTCCSGTTNEKSFSRSAWDERITSNLVAANAPRHKSTFVRGTAGGCLCKPTLDTPF